MQATRIVLFDEVPNKEQTVNIKRKKRRKIYIWCSISNVLLNDMNDIYM